MIKDEGARNDDASVGFLIDVGMGVEYQLSDRLFLGTQMMLDFLPKQTQEQKFIFAWQIGGLRYAFRARARRASAPSTTPYTRWIVRLG